MMLSVVVLPQPLGPSNEKNSPWRIARSIPFSAATPLYRTVSPRSSIALGSDWLAWVARASGSAWPVTMLGPKERVFPRGSAKYNHKPPTQMLSRWAERRELDRKHNSLGCQRGNPFQPLTLPAAAPLPFGAMTTFIASFVCA